MTGLSWLVPTSRGHRVALLAILLGGLALRLYGFRGFGAADDAAYAQIAHHIGEGSYRAGTYDGPAVFPLRVGIIWPTALAFRWFGVSEWTMVSFPFLLSLLSIVLAYLGARYFFGPRAGLLAAAMWALLPLDVFHASILVPDLAAAFFASLGILGLIILDDSGTRGTTVLLLAGAGAGLAFGASWLCKEAVAYAAPFCLWLIVRSWKAGWQRQLKVWGGVALGSLAVLLGEALAYHAATGDWLFHFHETERNYRQYQNAFFVSGSALADAAGGSYARAVLRRLVLDGPSTILLNGQFLYLPLLAVVITLHALYRRDKAYRVPAIWLGTLAFMFNFSSSSLTSYVPLVLFDRYLYPLFLPAIILLAGFLARLLWEAPVTLPLPTRREGPFWGALLIGWLLLVAAYRNYGYRKFAPEWVSASRTVSRLLTPSDRIYTDILSINGLEFFWSYPDTMNTVNFEDMPGAPAVRAGDYVLLNRSYLDWLVRKAGWWPTKGPEYARPEFAGNVPSSWETIWEGGNATLYRAR